MSLACPTGEIHQDIALQGQPKAGHRSFGQVQQGHELLDGQLGVVHEGQQEAAFKMHQPAYQLNCPSYGMD